MSRAERAHASAYYTRFSLAYTLLIMLAVAAVAGLVLILQNVDAPRSAPWSKFVPTGSALDMERQIATQVSSEYKATAQSRLVTVFPGPLQAPGVVQGANGPQSVQVPVSLIAVQPDVSTGQHEQGDFSFYQPDSTVGYEMCGFGDPQQNCGVPAPSATNPEPLLRREALELALYTLKYVPGTNAVVTYLPPTSDPQAPTRAVFTTRNDVDKNLHLPLVGTLEPRQILLGSLPVPDGGHVAALTRIFTTSYQTLPSDGTAALTLTPATTG
ncbi:MAG TPA: hypothetical protein VJ716_07195 [Gaiellaceae bacterium]|nr:hypothetical protein [Gaiellaceae bacterium]